MIRTFAWGWLFWRHRAAVRRGWRWGQGKDRFARFGYLLMREYIPQIRAEMNREAWGNEWRIPVVQSDPAAIVTDR